MSLSPSPSPLPVLPLPAQKQMPKVPLQVLTHHGPVPFLPEPSVWPFILSWEPIFQGPALEEEAGTCSPLQGSQPLKLLDPGLAHGCPRVSLS